MFHSFFFQFPSKFEWLILLFTFLQFYYGHPGQQSRQFCEFFFFLLIIIRSSFLAKISWYVCMSKSHGTSCMSFSRTAEGLCIYHLPYGQISVPCTSFSVSLCLPSRVLSYTPSVLICCIRLLCDWWFRLYHHITYICYFVASYLWYDWFLWHCFVLLMGEVLFLPNCFLLLATSMFSRVRCCLLAV